MKRSLNSRHSWNLHSLHSLTACHPCDICCTVRSKCVVNEVTVNVWHARVVSLTYLGDLVESSPMVLCHPWMQALTREKALTLKLILVPGCPSAPISASAFFKTVEGHTTKHQSKGPLKISSHFKPTKARNYADIKCLADWMGSSGDQSQRACNCHVSACEHKISLVLQLCHALPFSILQWYSSVDSTHTRYHMLYHVITCYHCVLRLFVMWIDVNSVRQESCMSGRSMHGWRSWRKWAPAAHASVG